MIKIPEEQLDKALDNTPIDLMDYIDDFQLDQKIDIICSNKNKNGKIANFAKYIANIFIMKLVNEDQFIVEINDYLKLHQDPDESFSHEILNITKLLLSQYSEKNKIQKNTEDKEQEESILSGWKKILLTISKENGLNIEQIGIAENLTEKILKGEIPSQEYGALLQKEAGLQKEKADNFTLRINEEILNKITRLLVEQKPPIDEISKYETLDLDVPKPPYTKEILTEEATNNPKSLSTKTSPSSHGELDLNKKVDPYREEI